MRPNVTGYFGTRRLGTIPIYSGPGGKIFGNHRDISEPTIRSSALMNFLLNDFFYQFVAALVRLCNKSLLTLNRIKLTKILVYSPRDKIK